ncbi:MAG: MBL fold metallo-hydrolase [Clostridia bacterium]|nr:MBL fold metallo-hydrolase [Clostridia bacterium]
MKLYTLGTAHGAAECGRACSVILLECGGKYYLFDCAACAESRLMDLGIDPSELEAIFTTHAHEDHVGGIPAMVKRIWDYNYENKKVRIYLTEEKLLAALRGWLDAMHTLRIGSDGRPMTELLANAEFSIVSEGEFYNDGNISVRAIKTRHLEHGKYPSYAFIIEGEGKKMLYTGDLEMDFLDYPAEAHNEQFDLVLCELVHFNSESPDMDINLVLNTKTKRFVFTHYRNVDRARPLFELPSLPFELRVATDGDVFEF